MSNPLFQGSAELFREILQRLRSETDWEPDTAYGDRDREIEAVRQGSKRRGELVYTHDQTTAQLSVSFPVYQTSDAMTILLDNPLDNQLQHSNAGFVDALGETHWAIAKRHETAYLEPVGDPSLIAKVQIPIRYDETTLTRTYQQTQTIAAETHRLHAELSATLQEYTNGTATEPIPDNGYE